MNNPHFLAAEKEIKRAIEEFQSTHPEPMPIDVSVSALLDFDCDGGRHRTVVISLDSDQCQQLYSLALTDMSAAMEFLFKCYGGLYVVKIEDAKVRIGEKGSDVRKRKR